MGMRYDKEVVFVRETEGGYNQETGNYEEPETIEESMNAHVSDTGSERMNRLYGGFKRHAKTIRLRTRYNKPFDHILYENRKYQVDTDRHYRHFSIFEVSAL